MDNHQKNMMFGKRGAGSVTVLTSHDNKDKQVHSDDVVASTTAVRDATHSVSPPDIDWYTRSLHRGRSPAGESTSRSSIPSARPASLATSEQLSYCDQPQLHHDDGLQTTDTKKTDPDDLLATMTPVDELAQKYFPLTLAAIGVKPIEIDKGKFRSDDVCIAETYNGSRHTAHKSSTKRRGRPDSGQSSTSSRSRSRRSRPNSAHSSSSSASHGSLDRITYMMNAVPSAPGQSSPPAEVVMRTFSALALHSLEDCFITVRLANG